MPIPLVLRNLMVAALVTGAAYLVFLGNRSDYLGHYLAGFGATLLLLCILVWFRKDGLGWNALVVTALAIAMGFVTESSIFRFAFFDPVDFCNQSIGACVACACVLGTAPRRALLIRLGIASLVLLAGGFVFAFA